MPLTGEIREFTPKDINTKYPASSERRLVKYGGISDESLLFPDIQVPFYLPFERGMSGNVSGDSTVNERKWYITLCLPGTWKQSLWELMLGFVLQVDLCLHTCSHLFVLIHSLNAYCMPSAGG